MPTNREIENFVELSIVIARIHDDTAAANRFMERNGIGVVGRAPRATSNGNGHAKRLSPAFVERVKRTYTKRQPLPVPLRQTSDIEITPTAKATYSTKRLQDRAFSLSILDALDRTEPRTLLPGGNKAIGALVRRGYAKKKGPAGHYVRTAKVFTITDKPVKTGSAPNGNGAAPESDALTVAEAAKVLGVSDSYVRLIVKGGKMTARQELRNRRGMHKMVPTMVLDRAELARYSLAEQTASS